MADKALLVGVNNYQSIGDLNGCLNDVENVKELLINNFDFLEANVETLIDEDAVYTNIQDGLMSLIDQAVEGDRLVFHFSGHGSFINSVNDDEAVDELLCLYDMDWDNGDSYLIDDDLGALLEDIEPGVHMTVILDACHSGTGTKAISSTGRSIKSPSTMSRLVIINDAMKTMTRGLAPELNTKSSRSGQRVVDEDANPPIARFIHPPKDVLEKMATAKLNRVGEHLRADDDYNHQLLAGADANQTAADAFIESKYQGAFTYHLCKSSRELGDGVTVVSVFGNAKSNMQTAGYHQIPQLEGIGQQDRLFGGEATEVAGLGHDDDGPNSEFPASKFESMVSGQSSMDVFADLIRVQEKFLDLGSRFLNSQAPVADGLGPKAISVSRGTEKIVYVHGISQHRRGYSDGWYESLRPFLTSPLPKSEVLWSDLVNPRNLPKMTAADSREVSDLKKFIEAELAERQKEIAANAPEGHKAVSSRGGFMIDDFVRYMTQEATRNEILNRFNIVVRPLLENGDTVHIISHSWGTVVAYEALRLMDQDSFSGKVENLFTVGAALSISGVQWNLFNRVADGRLPRHVRRVVNMDAGGDIVGGEISGAFTCHHERVNLVPTGCMRIPFTNTAISISCAHSSYFDSDNVTTNRDLFARWINA